MIFKFSQKKRVLKDYIFLIFSLCFGFIGQYFFYYKQNLFPGILFFIIASILYIFFDRNLTENNKTSNIDVRLEIILFFVIFITGIFFRIYDLKNTPPGFFQDEALASMDAFNIMRGEKVLFQETSLPVYIKGQVDNPALLLYLLVFVFKFFGLGIEQARIAGAVIPGILAIPALYFLVRYVAGARAALAGTFLFSVMRWHIIYSRFLFHASFCVLVVILFLYFFIRSYKEKKWIDFVLMGFLAGLTQHTYQPVKLIFAWMAVFYLFVYFKEKIFFIKNYKKLITAFLIIFIIILPLLIYIKDNQEDYFKRIKLLSIFNKENPENFIDGKYSFYKVLFNSTTKTLLMFNYKGDENVRHNYAGKPMLDFITGVMTFLGIIFIFSRIYDPLYFLFGSFFIFSLLGSILNVAAPHATRTIMSIPVIIISASIIIEKILTFFESKRNYLRILSYTFIIAALIISMILNYRDYFYGYGRHIDLWDSFSVDQSEAAKYLISLGDDWQGITAHEYGIQYYKSAPFNFVMKSRNKNNYECFNLHKHIPVNPQSEKNYIFIFPAGYETIADLLKRVYPGGTYKPFYKKYNEKLLSYFVYEIKKEDIKNPKIADIKNGLTGYYYNGEKWRGKLMDKRHDYLIFIHNDPAVISGICSIKWKGRIIIHNEGFYNFQGESEDDVSWDIIIDDNLVAESPAVKGKIFDRKKVFLKQGIHKIEIRCTSFRDIQKIKMFWIPPGASEPPVIIPNEVLMPEIY